MNAVVVGSCLRFGDEYDVLVDVEAVGFTLLVGSLWSEYGDLYGGLAVVGVVEGVPLCKMDGIEPENVRGFELEDVVVIVLDGVVGLIVCNGLEG